MYEISLLIKIITQIYACIIILLLLLIRILTPMMQVCEKRELIRQFLLIILLITAWIHLYSNSSTILSAFFVMLSVMFF
jgi:hypothetical protein